MPSHLTHRRNDHGMFRFNHFVHHAVSKIAKKLAIRRLAAHFPAGSELD